MSRLRTLGVIALLTLLAAAPADAASRRWELTCILEVDEKPVVGAPVEVWRELGGAWLERIGRFKSDSKGRIRVKLDKLKKLSSPVRATSRLRFRIEGYETEVAYELLPFRDPRRGLRKEANLWPTPARVTARVLDARGNPPHGGMAALIRIGDDGPVRLTRIEFRGRNGFVSFALYGKERNPAPETKFEVWAYVPGQGTIQTPAFTLPPEGPKALGVLRPAYEQKSTRITVRDLDGKPVAGLPLNVSTRHRPKVVRRPLDLRGTGAYVWTDAKGQATIERPSDGTQIWVGPQEVVGSRSRMLQTYRQTVTAASDHIEIRLQDPVVRIEVGDLAGRSIGRDDVTAYGWNAKVTRNAEAKRLEAGDKFVTRPTWRAAILPRRPGSADRVFVAPRDGAWWIAVRDDALHMATTTFDTGAKASAQATLRLGATQGVGRVRIRLTQDEKQVPGRFEFKIKKGRLAFTHGEGDSGDVIRNLPAGRYSITVSPHQLSADVRTFQLEIPAKGQADVDVEVAPAGWIRVIHHCLEDIKHGSMVPANVVIESEDTGETFTWPFALSISKDRTVRISMSGYGVGHTGDSRRIHKPLPPGRYRVSIKSRLLQAEPVDVDVVAGKTVDARLGMRPR